MPVLTEQERQEIMARRQSTGQTPSGLPMEIQSIVLGGRAPSVRMARPKPTSTESTVSERASADIAKTGLVHVARLRDLLQLGGTAEAPTMEHRSPITPSVNSPFPWDPGVVRNTRVRDPEKKQMRDDIESAISLLALLRTGKAGETAQIKNIRSTRTIGQGEQDDPVTVTRRLADLEREFQQYADGTLVSPLDKAQAQVPVLSKQGQSEMERLLEQ